jgi:hypothetical protein
VFLCELVRDRKTQTGAVGQLAARRPEAVERPEDSLHFLPGYPGPAVAYLDSDLLLLAVQVDVDRFAVAVLHGVFQQVREHSFQGDRVGKIDAGRVIAMQSQVGPFQFQVRCERFDHLPEVELHGAIALDAP